jgi:hypothetical protein
MYKRLARLWMLRNLIRSWREFRDLVLGVLGADVVSAEQEERFLQLKARVAAHLPGLTASIPPANQAELKEQFAQITELLNRFRSLRADAPLDQAAREDFERRWHRLFLYLNTLKGLPEPTAPVQAARRRTAFDGTSRRSMRRPLPGARLLGFVIRLGLVALVIYVLGRAFGLRWDASGRFTAQGPLTVSGLGQNFLNAMRSLSSSAGHLADPVVATYGSTLTIVLFAIVLLGAGYWVFVRR